MTHSLQLNILALVCHFPRLPLIFNIISVLHGWALWQAEVCLKLAEEFDRNSYIENKHFQNVGRKVGIFYIICGIQFKFGENRVFGFFCSLRRFMAIYMPMVMSLLFRFLFKTDTDTPLSPIPQ